MTFDNTVCATYTYGIMVNTNLIQVIYKNITFLDLANLRLIICIMKIFQYNTLVELVKHAWTHSTYIFIDFAVLR